MKKFLLSLVAILSSLCMNAATELTGSFSPWGDNCIVDGASITYSEAWAGAGFWLASSSEESDFIGCDLSSADYIWVTLAKGNTANIKMVIQYTSACTDGAAGTSQGSCEANDIIIAAKLDADQKNNVAQFFLQGTSEGSFTITGIYVGTEAEYQEALKKGAVSSATVWEGEQTFDGSWPAVTIPASKFASMKAGDAIIVTVSQASNSIDPTWQWGPQVFIKADWADNIPASSVEDGATDVKLKFVVKPEELAKILAASEIQIQGMNVIVTKVEIEVGEALPEWEETGKTVALDADGHIPAAEFNGFSLDAKVEFTFSCSDPANYSGWGAASITDIEGNEANTVLPAGKFGVKGETTKISTTLAELLPALNAISSWGTYGLYWNIWGWGECVNERVSCTIYEMKGATSEKFQAKADANVPLYVVGNVEGSNWDNFAESSATLEYKADLGMYVGVINVTDGWEGDGWFAITQTLGTAEEVAANNWDNFNANRMTVSADYGTLNETASLVKGVDQSFKLAVGTYTLYVDVNNMTIKIESGNTAVESVSVSSAKSGKFVENGNIVIYKNGKKFNVAGVSVK